MTTTNARIDALDDKDALNVVAHITTSVMSKLPGNATAAALPALLDPVAHAAGLPLQNIPPGWEQRHVDAREAGNVARTLLHALATPGDGEAFVAAAIDEFPSETQDLGLLSVPIAAGFFYIAVVSEFDVDLGWFKFKKRGLSAAQQVELGKSLLPKIFAEWFKVGTG